MGLIIFGTVAAAALWIGYLVTRRVLPDASPSMRWSGSTILAYGVMYALLRALLLLHAFFLVVALVALLATATAAHVRLGGREGWVALRRDVLRCALILRTVLRGPWLAVGIGVLLLVGSRLVRGLVLPPMGWDALVYHLFKAGRWVQLGTNFFQRAPIPWGHYEYMPAGGSCLWSWALLSSRDGGMLAPAAALVWTAIVLGGYAAARRFGAPQAPALACGAVLGTAPAVCSALTASYIDNTSLAACTLALVFSGASRDGAARSEPGETALLGIALGLGAATKTTVLPVLGLAGVLVAFRLAVSKAPPRRRIAALSCFVVPSLIVGAVEYGRAVWEHGNPVYPFALSFGGIQLARAAPGAPVGADLAPYLSEYRWTEPLRWIFLPIRRPRSDFAGLGPGALAVLALGGMGAIRIVRDRERRWLLALPLIVVAVVAAGALSAEAVALRTLFASVLSRHLLPAYAAVLVAAAVVPARVAWPVWCLGLASNLCLSLPLGWGVNDAVALGAVVLFALTGVVAGILVASIPPLSRKSVPLRAVAVLTLATMPVALGVPLVRAAYRYPIWNSTLEANGGTYDFHSLDGPASAAWPIWQRLDAGEAHRIAVTTQWGIGPAYLFPLMGSRLQNFVTYVPPTVDGSAADDLPFDERSQHMQLRVWLQRLVDARIDRVVGFPPSAPERIAWMEKLPDVFIPEVQLPDSDNWLYRFDRAAAERLIAANGQ